MKEFDVIVIGAGISGAALFYELARYTDIKNIALLEKYNAPATLNSKATSNSQTIHCGDIETNYSAQKAAKVKPNADMVVKYALKEKEKGNLFVYSHQKMVLAVGDKECEYLTNRYEEFKSLYPYAQFFDKTQLKKLEPKVVLGKDGIKDRSENIVAMGAEAGKSYTTIDFGKMSESLVKNATQEDKNTFVAFNQEVIKLEKKDGYFYIFTKDYQEYRAKAIVVNAGAHSLYLAHKMGVGLDKSCWPVAGSFYLTKQKLLNGKVYTVQNPKLPFAALHGDPDIMADMNTRFGPTALVIPKLERYRGLKSMPEFFEALKFDKMVAKVSLDMLKDKVVRNYIFYNYLYEIPMLNKQLFAKKIGKIIPSLKPEDIYYAHGFGGVRPQVIDKTKGELLLGEASINDIEGIIFNMTPSPGATSCLGNAKKDALSVCTYLGAKFDEDKFQSELV
ncbi:malate:quinone oxidoreductase [Campylobacter sp. MIT 12-5580]|uniref:FAD-dependent oxidoreductase n=1 Tax=Campylobacter sp. MIT 12-5580 TaxID=2040651 RepID=UPI0010F6B15C|nr:FAD-dependent oxidoreductase [Campylobacter sp. MIT 12-5580]TKX30254.1 malate:quinone oxidoreductase [Campylobacter sp. MIT 12-5580]